jgi:hypothetical protein
MSEQNVEVMAMPVMDNILEGQTSEGNNFIQELIRQKHKEYLRGSHIHQFLYYFVRLVASLSAGLLPFVVASSPATATGLSIAIVITTVVDMVFNPKDKWQLYSRASDLLAVEQLKQQGDYTKYKEMISILVNTELAKLEHLVDFDELIKKAKGAANK